MPYDDLRSFLAALESHDQLLHITERVQPEPDLAAAAVAGIRMSDRSPALYFDNIAGFTDARVLMNTVAGWQNLAVAMDLDPGSSARTMFDEWVRRWDAYPVAPERRDNPPWAENTVSGDDINLFELMPLFRLNQFDAGFYLDKGAVVSRDPEDWNNFDTQNVGCYRMQVRHRRHLNILPIPVHDLRRDCPEPSARRRCRPGDPIHRCAAV
ncbi:UbiD family decarboxylase [Nocardia sp. CDC159]|uniref:UbiD family decarboxylase n=1 Tax=Nocardia pulmonis TaxID=2951408 RepID=A0A9X2J0D2_9NOCA|nr:MULTISPECIES: UbiD family decarboxylase domain-containing protein [Nocardia]MCM6778433.1 UbiD family decarboxylase [Nocardia pulmonis]MCM6791322.1 UbiD family decarboxylase [Nocardia sp. CDC159]